VTIQWFARFALPAIFPDTLAYGVGAGVLGGVAILVWWLFFSRAPRRERWGAAVLAAAAMAVTSRLVHASIGSGMMGLMFPIFAMPVVSLAFVAWAAIVRPRLASADLRFVSMAAAILLVCGGWTLVRTNGINGSAQSDFAWRWAPTAEDRLLAAGRQDPPAQASPAAAVPEEAVKAIPAPTPKPAPERQASAIEPASWPGFRGPHRDGAIPGMRIDANWPASPPVQLWRKPIGPGWSSFAVGSGLVYTQEQRGEEEAVSAYSLRTGEPVWRHADTARFWESNAGAGPRGTPTLSNGRVYTFGATGILNALDARDGSVKWSRNAAVDTGAKLPGWGFSSSPLVTSDGMAIVAAAGTLAAYDAVSGALRWIGPKDNSGYSSPHLASIDGEPQILLLNGSGIIGVTPATGKLLWEHRLTDDSRIVQPTVISGNDGGGLLVSEGEGHGIRRISVSRDGGAWKVEERWTSNGLKPYFSDLAVHKGYAFGFDGRLLSCIDVQDGKRKWKGGRYGAGQLILLPDQDVLLVLSEEGELALVAADAGQFTELARFPAIEGKTWNHPVLVDGGVLLVRNGQEMAAFRLTMQPRGNGGR
jgi:outer membrane protein assembly factor BamB